MKKTYLYFGNSLPKMVSRRFPGSSLFGSAAYKTDAEIALEKKQAKQKEDEKLITEKEVELKAIKIDKPEDFTKAFTLYKEIAELKGKNLDEKLAAIEEAQKALTEAKPEVTADELKAIKDDLDVTIKAFDKLQIRMKNTATVTTGEVKTLEDVIREALEKKHDVIKKFERKEIKKFDIELDMKAVGAMSTANTGAGATWGFQRRPGIIMNPNTRQHVRDLLPVLPAGPGTDYYFMKESGVGEGSIAATSETTAAAAATTQATGLKPQFDLDLVEAHVPFEIIAGWMLISRKALNNIPGITAFLQSRLPEKMLDAEDQYVLYGTGTTPQIKGILTAGNFTASTSGSSILVEKILDDIATLENSYKRIANGILMRPTNYWSFFKNKAAGSGEYDLPQGAVFVGNTLYLWGIPVAKTTALTADDYVVGDFQNGATLLVQESMRLEFFEQDSTNVRTNQVTVRIEEVVALPVYGSDYFIKGTDDES